MTRLLARCAFFLSGVAGLTFEIVWLRHLGWEVGATTLAVATTTAAYMGGLAVGSHIGGRIADRLRRPLAVYGALEIGIALVGLLVPLLCAQIPALAAFLYADDTSGVTRSLARFAVAVLVLIIPTTAMGMTLPVLARAVTDRLSRVGREVGVLYALNLAGATIGAAAAGFWWIPHLGLSRTNLVAVGIDLLLGLVAVGAGLRLTQPLPVVAAPNEAILKPGSRALVAMLVITGAAAMVLQVLWTRALGTALGPSTYAFSAIVCAYLVGLAIGGALAAWVADHVIAARYALAWVLVGTSVACLFGITVVDDLPLLLQRVVLDPHLTVGGLFRAEFLLAAFSLLPATVGMGAIFPLTLAAVVGSEARLGAAVGRAYAVNTVGNILGSFSAAFIVLPLVGVEWGLRLAAIAYVVVAAWLTATVEPSVRPLHRRLAAGATIAAGLMLVVWPGWNVSQWTAGMFRMSMTRYYYADGDFKAAKLIFHRDGLSTTVTVEEESGSRWIKVNGKIDGSSEGDMPTQVLSGTLPALFSERFANVAVIGCGSGVTVGAALRANPEALTLIELDAAVIEGAKLFEDVNHAPWNDPRVRVVEDDGRNFLARRGPTYDVIISEPSNPWMTGAASLFTTEFFSHARRRLSEDGTFLQWLQIYELAPERILSVLKTFQSVFPYVMVFTPALDSNDLLILGRSSPWRVDWAKATERLAALGPEMERAEVDSLEELLALMLFTDAEIVAAAGDVPLNTDDNAFIEFGAPRDLLTFAEDDPEVAPIKLARGQRAARLASLSVDPAQWPAHLPELASAYLANGMLGDARAAVGAALDLAGELPAAALAHATETKDLLTLLTEADGESAVDKAHAETDAGYAAVLLLLAADEEAAALEAMETLKEQKTKDGPTALLYGYLLYRADQNANARQALLKARAAATEKNRAAIEYYLARASYEEGEFARALAEMRAYRQIATRTLSPPARQD